VTCRAMARRDNDEKRVTTASDPCRRPNCRETGGIALLSA
jgi:hypothetical protein